MVLYHSQLRRHVIKLSIPFSNIISVIKAEIHKMLVRLANMAVPAQTASDLCLHCLSRPFWQTTSGRYFRTLTVSHWYQPRFKQMETDDDGLGQRLDLSPHWISVHVYSLIWVCTVCLCLFGRQCYQTLRTFTILQWQQPRFKQMETDDDGLDQIVDCPSHWIAVHVCLTLCLLVMNFVIC